MKNTADQSAVRAVNWIYVMDDAALLEGSITPVYPLGINVVLARVEGIIYAVSGACPHLACPLFTGKLSGYTIACPCHDWRFDIRTGKFLDAPELGVAVFPVKSEAGKVFVKIS